MIKHGLNTQFAIAALVNNAGQAKVTCAVSHNLSDGDKVSFKDINGGMGFVVAAITSPAAAPAVVTTTAAHGLISGQRVQMQGVPAVVPATVITDISEADPCVVTAADHGLVTGMAILISGVVGVMALVVNTAHIITRIDDDTFSLNGINTGTRTVEDISNASPAVVTITAHGLVTGMTVTIAGVVGEMDDIVNAAHVITVIDADTFSIPINTGLRLLEGVTAADPAVVTITAHGLADGQTITISGVTGDMAVLLNAVHTITLIGDDTFSLDGIDTIGDTDDGVGQVDPLTYTSDGTVAALGYTSDGATSGAELGNIAANASSTVTVLSTTTFEIDTTRLGNGGRFGGYKAAAAATGTAATAARELRAIYTVESVAATTFELVGVALTEGWVAAAGGNFVDEMADKDYSVHDTVTYLGRPWSPGSRAGRYCTLVIDVDDDPTDGVDGIDVQIQGRAAPGVGSWVLIKQILAAATFVASGSRFTYVEDDIELLPEMRLVFAAHTNSGANKAKCYIVEKTAA